VKNLSNGIIKKIAGPLVVAKNMKSANMFDVVRVGDFKLIGEIIEMHEDEASIQVYEETSGLGPGSIVESTKVPLSIELGPGLVGSIFDGIGRPLKLIMKIAGNNLKRGVDVFSLDRKIKWNFAPCLKSNQNVSTGDVIGYVEETPIVTHKIMIPNGVSGKIKEIYEGEFTVNQSIAIVVDSQSNEIPIKMMQTWPVRVGRPYKKKLSPNIPMITGQRVIDTLFPIAKGGVAAVPGPFGSGKTVVQHQLAKWAEVDIVVYIGCGERGNEMTDVLNEFPSIIDPKTGNSLMERTILIANTSDMPVAAREASIYTGITIAEYFRDMGYSVALMADSTSRWAEALREMSGRLEEMPGEEGYPAYLGSRLSSFYERAGRVQIFGDERNSSENEALNDFRTEKDQSDFSDYEDSNLKSRSREGILTVIGAVSPPGGDLSEPVCQATLRIVKVFWGLDSSLAYKRHFPAINWLNSYSLYVDSFLKWYDVNVSSDWMDVRKRILKLLSQEAELEEVVKLVGIDALSSKDRLKLETARSVREDFLHQNAFHEVDTYTSLKKQYLLMKLILEFFDKANLAIDENANIEKILSIPVREKIGRFKYIKDLEIQKEYEIILQSIIKQTSATLESEDLYAQGV
jgi:V/A-type H+-transporting ATPase subunit A